MLEPDVHLAVSLGPVGSSKRSVIKELRPDFAGSDEYRTMFLGEARLAARLRHPNVVMDFLEDNKEQVEKAVFFNVADLMNADVDVIFYDTTSLHFEVEQEDDANLEHHDRDCEPVRKLGHSKNGRGDAPQIVVGLAITRDGLPVRSWVLPGNTADVATVERVKNDLRGWRLGRCVFVGDAGMNSEQNRRTLALGGGKYILASGIRAGDEVTTDVLRRPGRYRTVAGNLRVKQVIIGDGGVISPHLGVACILTRIGLVGCDRLIRVTASYRRPRVLRRFLDEYVEVALVWECSVSSRRTANLQGGTALGTSGR